MNQPRRVRELAMVLLYRIDAESGLAPDVDDARDLAETLHQEGSTASDLSTLGDAEVARALALAKDSFEARSACDETADALAPEWPSHRRPAIDRSIIRLAIHEMGLDGSAPKAIVNDAVEFAKRYSTEKSPAFVNAVLDKVLRRVLAGREAEPAVPETTPEGA